MKGKKGAVALILGLLACLTSAIFLTGCKHEHEYSEQIVAANCGVAGSRIYTCEECGDSYTEEIPATGAHKHTPQLYSNDAQHWYFCEVCYQNVKVAEHTWNEGVVTVPATFETTGIKTYKCNVCDREKQEEIPIIPHEHEWDQGIVTLPATMTETGIRTYTCATCDKQKQEEIPMIPHTHVYSTDWLSDGTYHWKNCSICLNEQEKQEHEWNQGVVTNPATTTSAGEKTYTCITCDKKKIETIPMLPHEHNFAAIWSSDEADHWHACSLCNDVQDKGAHVWDEGLITLPATTTSTGLKQFSCTICQRVKTEEIPMLPATNSPIYALYPDLGSYMVTGFDGMAAEITIPATYNGLRVRGIAKEAFYKNPYVKKITLPNTIRTIEEAAFEGCTSLTSINIPESVTSIGWKAFKGCTALTSVLFDAEIAGVATSSLTIDKEAFKGCINLASVSLAENTKEIGDSAFENCFALQTVNFNERLLSIGANAFANCRVLDGVVFNQALQTIGRLAFDNCIALTAIVLPDSLLSVGAGAFRCAEKLQEVTLSVNMTAIENATFQYCKALKEIVIHENIETIGISAFSGCESLQDVSIMGDISVFGHQAFYGCEKLETLYFNSSTVSTLYNEHYIFYNAGIKGNGITLTIGADAFIPHGLFEAIHNENAPNVTKIIIEDGATEIDYFTTYNYLPYVTEIVIPETVVTIGYNAFGGCTVAPFTEYQGAYYLRCGNNAHHFLIRMKEQPPQPVEEGETVETVDITLHKDAKVISYGLLMGWYNVAKLTLPFAGSSNGGTENTHFGYIFGASAYTNNSEFVPALLKGVVVTSAEEIAEFAFYDCNNLMSIEIGDGITSIGNSAFYDCSSLTSIEIGDGVTTIGDDVFAECYSLTIYCEAVSKPSAWNSGWASSCPIVWDCNNNDVAGDGYIYTVIGGVRYALKDGEAKVVRQPRNIVKVNIPLSVTHQYVVYSVTSIGYQAFYNCSSLASVEIGDSVTLIESSAFYNCSSLASVEIGDSVTFIGSSAFYNCDSLTKMTLPFVGESKSATGYEAVFGYIFGYETRNSSSPISGATYQYYKSGYSYGYYHYYIPESLKEVIITGGSIGGNAFYNCSNLTSITISDSVDSIGASAFYNTGYYNNENNWKNDVLYIGKHLIRAKTTISGAYTIKDGTLTIASSAFSACGGLTSITIPDSVTFIGSNAFYDCYSLTSVYIPSSVKRIGYYAFYGCSSLTSLSFGSAYYYTWYRTSNSSYQNGTSMSLTNSSTNASYFTSNYYSYYWYRN